MQSILTTVGATCALLLVASLGLSWLNAATIQLVVNRTGKSNSRLWVMRPGIFVHEALHAAVGWLFGLRVTQFSLRANAQSAAHVSFAYNRHNLRHQLGLCLASTAPLWGIDAVLLIVGKRAWFHGVAWADVRFATLAPDWPWAAGWAVLVGLLTFGASLSKQDLKNTLGGLPIILIALAALYLVGRFGYPPLLIAWQQANWLLAVVNVLVAGVFVVVNRACAWL